MKRPVAPGVHAQALRLFPAPPSATPWAPTAAGGKLTECIKWNFLLIVLKLQPLSFTECPLGRHSHLSLSLSTPATAHSPQPALPASPQTFYCCLSFFFFFYQSVLTQKPPLPLGVLIARL